MLEEALADFDGSVLVVSHDRYFLDRICDQIVAFEDAGIVVQPGNYSYYLEKRKEREGLQRASPGGASPAAPAEKPLPAKTDRPRKLSFKEQRELEGIEATILAAEMCVTELEKLLNDPGFYVTRAKEAPTVNADLEAAKIEVTRLYARWEELSQIGKWNVGELPCGCWSAGGN